ncbi:MAG: hypothetical protein AAF798_07735 [Bacteroidota bacterium]
MNSINFQYPTWFIPFCILLGLAYALTLYFRNQAFREQSKQINLWLGILRFLAVTTLAILLLEPFLKSSKTDAKKPIIIVAQDQSESILSDLSEEEVEQYKTDFQSLKSSFSEDYEVKEYAFGSSVREGIDYNFEDKTSNIAELMDNIYDLYSNQNLGAIVLATDGIYNEGSNPLYTSTKLPVPIYTLALGDTTAQKDLILKRVFHNKIAYLGDRFTIQVDVGAQNCAGSTSTLVISKIEGGSSRRLQELPISIDRNDFFTTREITLDADQSGVQRYRISLTGVGGEENRVNNTKDIFVDVLDGRQKVLLLANSPHPDITALRQSLSNNKNYEVEVAYANNIQTDITQFDFVMLHQLPSATVPIQPILTTLNAKKIPRLYIVGTQTDLQALNAIQSMTSIVGDGRNTNEVQGKLANDFSLFTISGELRSKLYTFPPLTAPFGEFSLGTNAQTLLNQRIGKIDTQYPLLVLGEQEGIKAGVLNGEGIWKWRLFDYLQHQNHFLFEELMGKVIQYLSLKEDKRRFRVSLSKNIFDENEAVLLDAELYNSSFELVNEPDATIVISSANGKDYNFTFNKTENAYTLNAGIFPVGNYSFTATSFYGGEKLTYAGQFSVQPIQLEAYATTADHNMLRLLSQKYGGELLYPDGISSIKTKIEAQETIVPILYETAQTQSVIQLKWIFFLLLTLLSLEWFFRRYYGAY